MTPGSIERIKKEAVTVGLRREIQQRVDALHSYGQNYKYTTHEFCDSLIEVLDELQVLAKEIKLSIDPESKPKPAKGD